MFNVYIHQFFCVHAFVLLILDVESRDHHLSTSSSSGEKFHLVRIGRPERIHSELTQLSLDAQAKKLLAKSK